MTDTDLIAQADAMLEGVPDAPWQAVESVSPCGQEWLGCGVLLADGSEQMWLEGSPESDLPFTRFIAASRQLIPALRDALAAANAARTAYASEFPPDENGDPDVGNIHENIRAMKAENAQLCAEIGENGGAFQVWRRRCQEAEAENARLREALRPFVEYVHDDCRSGTRSYFLTPARTPGGGWIGAEDLRRARAALTGEPQP